MIRGRTDREELGEDCGDPTGVQSCGVVDLKVYPVCCACYCISCSKRASTSTPRRSQEPPISLREYFIPCRVEHLLTDGSLEITRLFGTDYRMRLDTSLLQSVPRKELFCLAESPSRACCLCLAEKLSLSGVPAEFSVVLVIACAVTARQSKTEICEDFDAEHA
jgi:hypothetical protein